MSTYYDFMVEAKYKDKWYNIDLHTKDFDGKLRHQYLATFSRSFVGQFGKPDRWRMEDRF